jgi:uncharacterized protein YjbI with pentapeptide repeats
LRNATAAHANLEGADLRDADLTGTNLRGARMTGTKLREADRAGVEQAGAELDPTEPEMAKAAGPISAPARDPGTVLAED